MKPSKHEYKDNVASTDATQTMIRDVNGNLNIRNTHAWGKYTKAIILVLVIVTVIAVPTITVPVYLKGHSRYGNCL